MHYGKKASWWRQCDVLGNVLGNLGSWYSCGCYFDTSLISVSSFSRMTLPDALHTLFRNGLRNMTEFKLLTPPPKSPDLNPIQLLWDVLNKQVRSTEARPHILQDIKDLLLTSRCQIPHTPSEVSWSPCLDASALFWGTRGGGRSQYSAGNKRRSCFQVTGDTVYNMLRLAEVECDGDERPLKPHKIRTTEVLHSPFDDIVPRETRVKKDKHKEEAKKSQSKATKNFSLLSFGEEAEEEEEMVTQVSQTMKGKSKSSHDLLKDDPKLSSVPVVDRTSPGDASEGDDETQDQDDDDDDEDDDDKKVRKKEMRERISKKLKKEKMEEEKSEAQEETEKKSSRSDELRKEARQLRKELLAIKQRKEERMKPEENSAGEKKATGEAVSEYLESKKKYEEMRTQKLKKGSSREAQTLALLDRFKTKLSSAISETPEAPDDEELEEDDDKGWMTHVLQFDEQSRKVKDANMQDEDTFEIYDPRNPVNKRRREESKKLLKEKKAKR
ncbi:spliceosome-associated protein CWC27 homolog isoform X2 [Ictalurus punctatus]|uniref:Spliceosome-associated protein CWC27 homolog isoform X2 n=1 Tax=Ictalurus punctatus TaxID=7998 RepID=A0A979F920_ICTPU|nr:spliceosome-associated protein CWC27 homolog isoform X2 [Ictalurus punctatus]